MAVPRSRIVDLMKVRTSSHLCPLTPLTLPSQVQCRIFNTVFNPTGQRLGTKILRQRLKGPALAAYYPRKVATFRDLQKAYPEWEMYDEKEEDRLEHVQIMKAKGKGPPKKSKVKIGMYNNIVLDVRW
jgi:hypothetical protein